MTTTLAIHVNGELRQLAPGCSVDHLLRYLELPPERVAVERNGSILPRERFADPLQAGDRLEIVTFVGGG